MTAGLPCCGTSLQFFVALCAVVSCLPPQAPVLIAATGICNQSMRQSLCKYGSVLHLMYPPLPHCTPHCGLPILLHPTAYPNPTCTLPHSCPTRPCPRHHKGDAQR